MGIWVLTTDGRPRYLQATVAGLLTEGAGEVSIHVDRSGSSSQGIRDVFEAAKWEGGDLYYFEDDIQLAVGALAAMQALQVPEQLSFLSFCDVDRGLGNQALKVPRRTLLSVTWPEIWGPYGSDVMLRTAVRRWGQVRPSIVRHVGETSNIDYSRRPHRAWTTWDFVPDARVTDLTIVDRYCLDEIAP